MNGCAFAQYVKLGWYPSMNTMRKLLLVLLLILSFENKSRSHVQLAAWWYVFCLWRTLLRYSSFITFWESGWKCIIEIVWKIILLKLGFVFFGEMMCVCRPCINMWHVKCCVFVRFSKYGISCGQYSFLVGNKIIFGTHFYSDTFIFIVLQNVT